MSENIRMTFPVVESLQVSEGASEDVGMSLEYLNGIIMGLQLGVALTAIIFFFGTIMMRRR